MTEEELKRLNEALADDDSYSAVSFDYGSSDKTEDESTAAGNRSKAFVNVFISKYVVNMIASFNFSIIFFA